VGEHPFPPKQLVNTNHNGAISEIAGRESPTAEVRWISPPHRPQAAASDRQQTSAAGLPKFYELTAIKQNRSVGFRGAGRWAVVALWS
ncbi:hypothetical protein SB780_37615, partial [Burkholderia sp. SIMBA_057]